LAEVGRSSPSLHVVPGPADGGGVSDDTTGGGNGGGGSGGPGPLPRDRILITTDEHDVTTNALAALAASGELYQRSGDLVHMVKNSTARESVDRYQTPITIEKLPILQLRRLMTKYIDFVKYNNKGEEIAAHPPDWCVGQIDTMRRWRDIDHLEAVVTTPLLRPDGTVLDEKGYDPRTGIMYDSDVEFDRILRQPTKSDAIEARDLLLETIAQFPLKNKAQDSCWMAALLSPFARYAYPGATPMFIIDKNMPGAGGSLLADSISLITMGHPMPRLPNTQDDEEMRKKITTFAMSAERMVLIDNVTGKLGTTALDACLTGEIWQDRILGKNSAIKMPMKIIWYATGNNLDLRRDTSRRSLRILIESKESNPEERKNLRDLPSWIHDNRGSLVSAAMTILRAYCVAGRPDMGITPWGSFDGWSRLIRHAVTWIDMIDPGTTRETLQEDSDTESALLEDVIFQWLAWAGDRAKTTTELVADMRHDEAHERTFQTVGKLAGMRSAWEEITKSKPGQQLKVSQISYVLRSYRNRMTKGGYRFVRDEKKDTGFAWRVEKVEDPHDQPKP
jgi:hypothetical protein